MYRVVSLSQMNRHDNWEEADAGTKSKLTSDFSFGKLTDFIVNNQDDSFV